jgi:uncharacterized membrane protein
MHRGSLCVYTSPREPGSDSDDFGRPRLSEQKTAKVIQLLEESRRDNPLIRDRVDQEAEVMAQPADPQSVLEAIKETHAEAEQISGSADGD